MLNLTTSINNGITQKFKKGLIGDFFLNKRWINDDDPKEHFIYSRKENEHLVERLLDIHWVLMIKDNGRYNDSLVS